MTLSKNDLLVLLSERARQVQVVIAMGDHVVTQTVSDLVAEMSKIVKEL